MDKLPNEVLLNIFSHINAVQLTESASVCKRWKDLIQAHPTLLRNASYLDYGDENISLGEILSRLRTLNNRCGKDRNVTSIGVTFTNKQLLKSNELCMKTFFTVIQETNPKNIWMNLWPESETMTWDYFPRFLRPNRLQQVFNSITPCSNLKTLYIRSEIEYCILDPTSPEHLPPHNFSASHRREFGRAILKNPSFHVQKLVLHGIPLWALHLNKEDQAIMLCDAKVIELKESVKINAHTMHSKELFDALIACKETIEEFTCEHKVSDGEWSRLNPQHKEILMPNLRWLNLVLFRDDRQDENDVCPTLICPKLRRLSITVDAPIKILTDLLNNTIESLVIVGDKESKPFPMKEFFQGCSNLRSLEVYNVFEADIQAAIRTLPVEQLIISQDKVQSYEHWQKSIINLITSRQHSSSKTKIKKLTIYEPKSVVKAGKEDKKFSKRDIKWLQQNIEEFTYFCLKEDQTFFNFITEEDEKKECPFSKHREMMGN